MAQFKVWARNEGSSKPLRAWGPFDSRDSAMTFIERKREEARRMGWSGFKFELRDAFDNRLIDAKVV